MTEYWKKQMEHEGTRLYYEKIKEIVSGLSVASVLEIGTGWGISGSAFLESGIEQFVTIDPNIAAAYGKLAKEELKTKVGNCKIQFIEERAENCLPNLIKAGLKFDLIYVDGDHGYEGVIRDLNFAEQLRTFGGHILMDDYLHAKNLPHKTDDRYGIYQAVREFLLHHTDREATIYPTPSNGFVLL